MKTGKLVSGYGFREGSDFSLHDICTNLSSYRKAGGYTQDSLGALTGMGKAQVCKIEKAGNPTVGTLERLFGAMGSRVMVRIEPSDPQSIEDVTADLVLCIHEFAKENGLTEKKAFDYLYRFGALDFYIRHYKVELAQSMEETMEDFIDVCRNNGGGL